MRGISDFVCKAATGIRRLYRYVEHELAVRELRASCGLSRGIWRW